MMDSPATGHEKLVICTLNDARLADELTVIIRAVTRTYQSIMVCAKELTGKDLPHFEVHEDLHYDDDCGSFRLEALVPSGEIELALAKLLDYEIDKFIKDRDLWSNRIPLEDYGKTTVKPREERK